jgi:hypothetical protein
MHLVPAQMSFVPKTQPHILHLVAAGVSPAVEPGILPGGLKPLQGACLRIAPGRRDAATAGETPAATGSMSKSCWRR